MVLSETNGEHYMKLIPEHLRRDVPPLCDANHEGDLVAQALTLVTVRRGKAERLAAPGRRLRTRHIQRRDVRRPASRRH